MAIVMEAILLTTYGASLRYCTNPIPELTLVKKCLPTLKNNNKGGAVTGEDLIKLKFLLFGNYSFD